MSRRGLREGGEGWQAVFHFDPDHAVFADHFPGRPVIPGSLILDCFHNTILDTELQVKGHPLRLCAIRNARFLLFASPGRVDVDVFRQAAGEERVFSCKALQKGKVLCSAVLHYRRP